MVDALDPNFRGLIHVLAGVLIREIAEAKKETEENENAPGQARSLYPHFDIEEEMHGDHIT